MKTAISVPDDTYERASKRAADLGMSRSEFFSRAAARYLDELDRESVTQQIDLAVSALGDSEAVFTGPTSVSRSVHARPSGAPCSSFRLTRTIRAA
jgi:hypothetical protein